MAHKVLKLVIGGLGVRIILMQMNQKSAGGGRPFPAARAFSFVEVLIASAIGLFIFASLFYGVANGLTLLDITRQNMRATEILLSRMEGVRLCAWDPAQLFSTSIIPATFTNSFYPVGVGGSTNLGVTYYGTMTVTTNITLTPTASYSANMAKVTITLVWTNNGYGRGALAHSASMNTYVSRNGLQNYVFTH